MENTHGLYSDDKSSIEESIKPMIIKPSLIIQRDNTSDSDSEYNDELIVSRRKPSLINKSLSQFSSRAIILPAPEYISVDNSSNKSWVRYFSCCFTT